MRLELGLCDYILLGGLPRATGRSYGLIMGIELPIEPGDYSKYESGAGTLNARYLIVCLNIHGPVDGEDKEGVAQFLTSSDAVLAGKSDWLIKTTMTPAQVVEAIRHHLTSDEHVCVFTVCDQLEWAGPRHVRRFFEAAGVRIQRREEIPPPVDPTTEP